MTTSYIRYSDSSPGVQSPDVKTVLAELDEKYGEDPEDKMVKFGLVERFLSWLIPKANPDFEHLYSSVFYWFLELEGDKPTREIGFTDDGQAIVIGPADGPLGRNYGLLTDSLCLFESSDWSPVSEEKFEALWNDFSTQLAKQIENAKFWETVKPDFQWDGSLRDLYVLDTSEVEWDALLVAIPTWSYQTRFLIDGEPAPIPNSARRVFQLRQHSGLLLEIDIGDIVLNCHFFTADEIELDLDPQQLQGPATLDKLIELMRRIGKAVQRPVILTPENGPEFPIIRYEPDSDEVEFVPAQGGMV